MYLFIHIVVTTIWKNKDQINKACPKMVLFRLKDCEIIIEEQDGKVFGIDIYKGGYHISIGTENFIEQEGSKEFVHYWADEDMQDREEYIKFFPEYHIVSKYIDGSYQHLFILMQGLYHRVPNPSYDEFISYLKEHLSIPFGGKYARHYGRMFTFETINDIVVSFDNIYSSIDPDNLQYRIGRCEFYGKWNDKRNMVEVISFDNLHTKIPFYDLYRKILELSPHIDIFNRILKMFTRLETIGKEIPLNVILDVLLLKKKPDIIFESGSSDSSWLCIHSPESQRTEENDGIPICTALIRENEWNSMISIVSTYPEKFSYEQEYTDGGYSASVTINIPSMLKNCKIIRDPSQEVITFIKQIKDNTFLDLIRDRIESILDKGLQPSDIEDERKIFNKYMSTIAVNPTRSHSTFSSCISQLTQFDDIGSIGDDI